MAKMSKEEILKRVRKKMDDRKGSGRSDPDEFRPPKAGKDDTHKYKFIVLPPIGDDWSEWSYAHGSHFLGNKVYQCPRIHDGNDCTSCQTGFDLMSEVDDKDTKRAIAQTWLPRSYYSMNVYFPAMKSTPEELRGQVKWYSAPKTIYDIMEQCLFRDDEGDPDDPQAYGLFFDPEACFAFQLEVFKKGDYNCYERSKFLPKKLSLAELLKDEDKAKAVLEQRFDLSEKFEERDPDAITAAVEGAAGGGEAEEKPRANRSTKKTEKKAEREETEAEAKVTSGEELLSDDLGGDDSDSESKPEAAEKPADESGDDEEEDAELAALLSDLSED